MRHYSAATLEAIARRELKAFAPALVDGQPRAIPIEDIVERHYGLEVEYRFLRKNRIALGCAVFDDTLLPVWDDEAKAYGLLRVKGGTIVIDASLLERAADGRLRFTFAHELAHWLIHRELYAGEGVAAASAIKTSLEVDSAVERQADLLATSLLMPKGQVKRAFHAARRDADPSGHLANLFGVSRQAMSIFMRDHNMT